MSAVAALEEASGSSPLTRGKQDPYYDALDATRLIPAHAGKTEIVIALVRSGTAHPRSRGENTIREDIPPVDNGSSPLTRGKPVIENPSLLPRRLIPAHAGKTELFSGGLEGGWAHPRSRGEN